MAATPSRITAGITGVGMYFPDKVLSNADLEKIVDTNDEWIVERTGIKERRVVEPGTPASALAVPASQQALQMARCDPEEIECIIVATVTPDMLFPATACVVQEKIGAKNAWAFDLLGACSGYLYALSVADGLVRSGQHKKVLVVGSEIMTSIVNWEDRNTCILFGDGAAATVIERMPDGQEGILGWEMGADGSGGEYLYMSAGGSLRPASHETVDEKQHAIRQEGRQVFKYAVEGMARVSQSILEKVGYTGDDVDMFIAHQANLRIIEYVRKKLKLPTERCMVTIDRFGNTTSATIPSALRIAHEEQLIKPGDLLLFATFGAGFTWGATALRWTPASDL